MEVNFYKEKGLICYVIDGVITAKDLRELQAARDRQAGSDVIKVMSIVPSFKGYESFETMKKAILEDIQMLPKLSKYAMLTDISLLRKFVFVLNLLIPKSKLKAFPLHDRMLAENWLD